LNKEETEALKENLQAEEEAEQEYKEEVAEA
jgi:hypothetical protein